MSEIHVTVGADVDGDLVLAQTAVAVIPPDYDQRDIDALVVRTVEDTAFDGVQATYGRQPTRRALIAAAARLKALEALVNRMPQDGVTGQHRARLRAIFALTNEEAIAQYGEDPEGG